MVMVEVLLALILFTLVACTLFLGAVLRNLGHRIEYNSEELRSLRLRSRARIRDASMQSGPVTKEQELIRAGRAAQGKRVVFGGEPDSEQSRRLRGGRDEPDTDAGQEPTG